MSDRAGTRSNRSRAVVLLIAYIAGCTVGVVALWSVHDPRFATPPLAPSAWTSWAEGREPLDAAASIARLLSTAALSYLLLASLVQVAVTCWCPARWRGVTARLTPAPLAALTTAALLGSSPMAAAAPRPQSPAGAGQGARMVLVEDPVTATTTTTSAPHAGASMRLLPTPDDAPGSTPRADPTQPTPARVDTGAIGPAGDQAPTPPATTVTVRPGDHLWGIAERRVQLALGTPPSEDQVRNYWTALIETNRDRLVDPSDPDLILPGQELVLPG